MKTGSLLDPKILKNIQIVPKLAYELDQLKKKEIEANRQYQQSHSYKQKNYLRKEPIFNERTEPIAALPPTILKLKAVPQPESVKGVHKSRFSVPPPQVSILNPTEVTDTQVSDN